MQHRNMTIQHDTITKQHGNMTIQYDTIKKQHGNMTTTLYYDNATWKHENIT